MRKLLVAVLAACVILPAHADGRHGSGSWVAPFIGGAVIGAIITQPRYIAPPPVYYTPPPYYPGTVYPDYIYRPMYREVTIYVPECSCYRTMMVQVN